MIGLILERASASRLSGEWSEDDYRIRQKLAAGIGRVLINAQISAGYALTLRLRHLWYWYFWLTVVQKMTPCDKLTRDRCWQRVPPSGVVLLEGSCHA